MEFWRAKQLRITAFPAKSIPIGNRNFWAELPLGESDRQEKTKGLVCDQGPLNDHWLMVTNAGDRIDWVLLPNPDSSRSVEFVDVGEFAPTAERFVNTMRMWFSESCPEIQRLAFGAEMHHSVEDRAEGYRLLSDYLPFRLDDENSQDFSYQINRPKPSQSSDGVRINRLTQWSVAAKTFLSGELKFGTPQAVSLFEASDPRYACQLTLDINTVPALGLVFNKQTATDILGEMLALSKEISVNGDRVA